MKKEMNIQEVMYLNSYSRILLSTHGYLCVLILEHPLKHTSYINIQTECSLGPSSPMRESECGVHISMPRQKEKQAGTPFWGSHLQLLPLLLAESPSVKQTELEAAIQVAGY